MMHRRIRNLGQCLLGILAAYLVAQIVIWCIKGIGWPMYVFSPSWDAERWAEFMEKERISDFKIVDTWENGQYISFLGQYDQSACLLVYERKKILPVYDRFVSVNTNEMEEIRVGSIQDQGVHVQLWSRPPYEEIDVTYYE